MSAETTASTQDSNWRRAEVSAPHTQEEIAAMLADSYAHSPKGQRKGPEWAARKGEKAAKKIDVTDPITRGKLRANVDVGLDDGPRRALARSTEGGTWVSYNGTEAGTKREVARDFRRLAKSPVDHFVAVDYVALTTDGAAPLPPVGPPPAAV